MRNGDPAGFFGVIGKIGLCIHIGMVADDFDRRFVSANRAIGTKTPEFTGGRAGRCGINIFAGRQGSKGDIIHDTDGESVLGNRQFQIVEHRYDMRRNHIFGT